MHSINLDNNASTPMIPAVWEAMQPFYADIPGNPASSHHAGRQARKALEATRELTAYHLGAEPGEVIFTSGATEANNLALFGLAGQAPGHLLSSRIEHPCVIEPLTHLQKRGLDLSWFEVDEKGIVLPSEVATRVISNTRVVALMLANHETGATQPVGELSERLKGKTLVHCDAAAAAGKMTIDFHVLGAATLTVSAHKFHGPKGIGALLVRRGVKLHPIFFGGHQQQGRRPGTEPVALAVGLATALDLAMKELAQRRQQVQRLRELFLAQLTKLTAPVIINGPETGGIPHTLNLSFPGCQADVLLMNFDLKGICCSTGSACSSGSLLPSPVLQAMNVPEERLHSAMRFSFSHLLIESEVIEAAQRIAKVVTRLRS